MPAQARRQKKQEDHLKRSILTHMIILPVIPFLLALGVSYYYFSRSLETNAQNSLTQMVQDHGQMITSFLKERRADLELIARSYTFERINDADTLEAVARNLKATSKAFVDLGVFDARGLHVQYAGEHQWLKGKPYDKEHWFVQVMKNKVYISDIFLGYRNSPHLIIAVKQGVGKNAWVLRATIDTWYFYKLVSQVKIGTTGESFLLNHEGIYQTHRESAPKAIMTREPSFPYIETTQTQPPAFTRKDAKGDTFLYAVTRLKEKGWLLVVRQDIKDAYSALYSAAYISLIILVAGLGVIVTAAVIITGRILRQINQLGTEKQDLGNQLIRASRLAEIGEMASGFAHEVNNPLQIIQSEYSLIRVLARELYQAHGIEKDPLTREITDSLDQIQKQVIRCSDITHTILKFGRKDEAVHEPIDPLKSIPEIVKIVEKRAHVNGVKLDSRLDPDTPRFLGDSTQFQQVMLNLLNNAMDAVTQAHGASGGRIFIAAQPGNDQTLSISIQDNGEGIRPENLSKIFSPFFTTKPAGSGTGLGLSICYAIIDNFGGTIDVDTAMTAGTRFVITLPQTLKGGN